MAYTVVGGEVREGQKLIDTCSNHGEGVAAAQDRAAPSKSTAHRATSGRIIAFDFEDAVEYRRGRKKVRAKQAEETFVHGGRTYQPGSWVVMDGEKSTVYLDEEFQTNFRPLAEKEQ